jgi:hypothetical protein
MAGGGLVAPPAIKLEHYSVVKERSHGRNAGYFPPRSSQLAELFQSKSSARFSQPGYEIESGRGPTSAKFFCARYAFQLSSTIKI